MELRSLVNPGELCYLEGGMRPKKSSPSKRKRTTDQLTPLNQRVGPEMFQAIAELGNDGILVFDEQHRIEFANRMASELTGYSNKKLLKRQKKAIPPNRQKYPWRQRARLLHLFLRIARPQNPPNLLVWYQRTQGNRLFRISPA